jgi:hypothetical protein
VVEKGNLPGNAIMPLLDHFHPPLSEEEQWAAFHGTWAVTLAEALNLRLPSRYKAAPFARAGASVEIDVATFEQAAATPAAAAATADGGAVATLPLQVWSPPQPALVMPAVFPSDFEVRIISTRWGPALVGAIELISPANKDRPETRRAFATKCASYLYQGVSLILVDIVTERQANLHNEIIHLMGAGASFLLPAEAALYAVAYRPVLRHAREEIDLWPATFAVGDALPTLPLRLTGDLFVPVELAAAYDTTCRRLRLA